MIEVNQAVKIIAASASGFGTETIDLSASLNRTLKEDWIVDRALPPFDRVTMDGIAIRFAAFEQGLRTFTIEGVVAAGTPQQVLQHDSGCLEVMTGAVMPRDADTVIRYEDLDIGDGEARILVPEIVKGQNIHFRGSDRNAGEIIVASNTRIGAPEIGIGSSIGKARVIVATLPKVMIVSTGDELVGINEVPAPYQIRRSNEYRMLTSLQAQGIHADADHLPDDLEILRDKLASYLANYDVLILSGGVSKGKFDFLPETLELLGVRKLFHQIQQRPGKPFWFGRYANRCTIFALPGNPVSSFMCLQRYFLDWLNLCLEAPPIPRPLAVLTHDVPFKPDLTYFPEVRLSYSAQGQILATPVIGNGSGDFSNLAEAEAFIELPRGKNLYRAGEVYPVYLYR
ncbi:MAG: molybdopterin molybdotransferase MoeA [Saprospiraceae bacterium]|jgi:molybdopterin molybdotransferase